jgi:hypothetical protein
MLRRLRGVYHNMVVLRLCLTTERWFDLWLGNTHLPLPQGIFRLHERTDVIRVESWISITVKRLYGLWMRRINGWRRVVIIRGTVAEQDEMQSAKAEGRFFGQ